MNKLIKAFPFLPKKGKVGHLVLALLLYAIGPSIVSVIVSAIIGSILGITIILLPMAPLVGTVVGTIGTVYTACGIVFSIFSYLGKEIDLEIKK